MTKATMWKVRTGTWGWPWTCKDQYLKLSPDLHRYIILWACPHSHIYECTHTEKIKWQKGGYWGPRFLLSTLPIKLWQGRCLLVSLLQKHEFSCDGDSSDQQKSVHPEPETVTMVLNLERGMEMLTHPRALCAVPGGWKLKLLATPVWL